MSVRWGWVALLCAACMVSRAAAPLRAQVVGEVRDTGGAPVPGVSVELWSDAGRVAAERSDAHGRFTLPDRGASAAGRIVLRRVGYEPLSAPFSSTGPHVYVLRAMAVILPELANAASREPCPRRDEPAARAIWRAAASRYARDTPSRGYSFTSLEYRAWVTPEDVGFPEESRLEPSAESRVGTDRGIEWYIAREGYAFRRQPGTIAFGAGRDYEAWTYPHLDGRHAYHFATEDFGRLNLFAVVSRDAEGTVLAFCSRGTSPSIEGTLNMGTDGWFISAGWKFRTPRPDEDAGGEVVFAPVSNAPEPHLLAARGLFWRRGAMRGRFWQRAIVHTAWVVGAGEQPPDWPRGR